MTEPERPPLDPDVRAQIDMQLLTLSSHMYGSDPLFYARCSIAVKAANRGMQITFGRDMNRDEYAVCVQACAIALVLAGVPDEELAESVDHGKVLLGMLEFSMAQSAVTEKDGDGPLDGEDD